MIEIRDNERDQAIFDALWVGDVIEAAEELRLAPETVMMMAMNQIEYARFAYEASPTRLRSPVAVLSDPKNGATFGLSSGEKVMVKGVAFFLNEGEIRDIQDRYDEISEVAAQEMRLAGVRGRKMVPFRVPASATRLRQVA